MPGVIFSSDLMCSSNVTGAANRLGLQVTVAMSAAALLEQALGAELVILDLNTPAADPMELTPRLRALRPAPGTIVAFGPHVHEDRLAAARQAGCDEVLTRGQFHASLPQLLARRMSDTPKPQTD